MEKIKSLGTIFLWNLIFYLALSSLVGSQYNVAGVYGLL